MGSKCDGDEKSDKSNLNQDNIIFPQFIDELPNELRQKLQAKLDADVKAFLESYTKNRYDKITQFCEPSFRYSTTSTSLESKVKATKKAKVDEEVNDDSYPTHANYAKMLYDQRNVFTNSIQHLCSLLNVHMDKIEGNITDCDQLGVKQPQFGMPLNFYQNQSSCAATNKLQSAPLAFETNNVEELVHLCQHLLMLKIRVITHEPIRGQ
jgi:hypothetical protein